MLIDMFTKDQNNTDTKFNVNDRDPSVLNIWNIKNALSVLDINGLAEKEQHLGLVYLVEHVMYTF